MDVKADKGILLRVPGCCKEPECLLDGKSVKAEKKEITGRAGWFIPVEQGIHKLEIK